MPGFVSSLLTFSCLLFLFVSFSIVVFLAVASIFLCLIFKCVRLSCDHGRIPRGSVEVRQSISPSIYLSIYQVQPSLCVQRAATSSRNAVVQIILHAPKSGTDSAVLYTQDDAMLISKCCSLCTTQQWSNGALSVLLTALTMQLSTTSTV